MSPAQTGEQGRSALPDVHRGHAMDIFLQFHRKTRLVWILQQSPKCAKFNQPALLWLKFLFSRQIHLSRLLLLVTSKEMICVDLCSLLASSLGGLQHLTLTAAPSRCDLNFIFLLVELLSMSRENHQEKTAVQVLLPS